MFQVFEPGGPAGSVDVGGGWFRMPDLNVPRVHPALVSVVDDLDDPGSSAIYVIGGRNSKKVELKSVERFNRHSNAWELQGDWWYLSFNVQIVFILPNTKVVNFYTFQSKDWSTSDGRVQQFLTKTAQSLWSVGKENSGQSNFLQRRRSYTAFRCFSSGRTVYQSSNQT